MSRRLFRPLVLAAGAAVLALTGSAAFAGVTPPTLTGETLIDPTPSITATCDASGTSTISFSADGTASAVFRGNALVNGVATTYRISVDDNGEPGAGVDTFSLSTDLGYAASGVLSEGNIQVHA